MERTAKPQCRVYGPEGANAAKAEGELNPRFSVRTTGTCHVLEAGRSATARRAGTTAASFYHTTVVASQQCNGANKTVTSSTPRCASSAA